jgi:uncharacterized membrane protein YbhN (UPF0104 family)
LAHTVTAPKVPAWTTLLGIALFGLALFWLHHLLGQYRWRDILAHVDAIPTAKLLRAALFTVAGYGCLTLYDALAVRFAGARVPYPRIALISFMGYAIGHNVGLNTLSGGPSATAPIRLWVSVRNRSAPSLPSALSRFYWAPDFCWEFPC